MRIEIKNKSQRPSIKKVSALVYLQCQASTQKTFDKKKKERNKRPVRLMRDMAGNGLCSFNFTVMIFWDPAAGSDWNKAVPGQKAPTQSRD